MFMVYVFGRDIPFSPVNSPQNPIKSPQITTKCHQKSHSITPKIPQIPLNHQFKPKPGPDPMVFVRHFPPPGTVGSMVPACAQYGGRSHRSGCRCPPHTSRTPSGEQTWLVRWLMRINEDWLWLIMINEDWLWLIIDIDSRFTIVDIWPLIVDLP